MKTYALLDVEDTGFAEDGAPIPQQVIEVAALVVSFPPVLPRAAQVNGYTPDAWKGYPEINARDLNRLADLLDGTQVVGSMPAYDEARLESERARTGARAPKLATHRRLDLGSVGAPLVEALGLKSGGMDAIIAGLESLGLAVPDVPPWLVMEARGRIGAHTAMGDAWRLLHVMRHVYLPAVERWQRRAA